MSLFLLFLLGFDGPIVKGGITPDVKCRQNAEINYSLFLPASYDPQKTYPLILFFEPAARALMPLESYQMAANEFGYILACPYGTANFQSWDSNSKVIEAVWNDLLTRFSIDPKRMYAGGMSGGARLASRVATTTGQIQAVLLSGAGFWLRPGTIAAPKFDVLTTVGNHDFNYNELEELYQWLESNKVAHRRLTFTGGHDWPNPDVAYEALAWLQVRAAQKKLMPESEVKQAAQMAKRQALMEQFKADGNLIAAYQRALYLKDDFPAGKLEPVNATLTSLDKDPAYKKAVKDNKKALFKEKELMKSLIGRLTRAKATHQNMKPIELKKELSWWRIQSKQLDRQRKSKDRSTLDAAERIYLMMRANFSETSVYYFQNKDYKGALFLNQVAEALGPTEIYPQINMAKAHCQLGDEKKALAAISKCIDLGLQNKKYVREEPLLQPLANHPRFKELLF